MCQKKAGCSEGGDRRPSLLSGHFASGALFQIVPLQEVVEDQAAADNKIPEIFSGGGHILLLVPLDIQLPRGDFIFDGQHLHIVGGPAQGPGNDSDA